jgi:hypothetical protein
MKYDDRNNQLHLKNSDDFQEWRVYDDRNNVINYKNSHDYQTWHEYDERNNLVQYSNSEGARQKHIIEYYSDGQLERYDSLLIPYFEKLV